MTEEATTTETPAQAPQTGKPAEGKTPADGAKTARPYDFRRPKHLGAEQMKNVHRVHSGVADAIQERLTRHLGATLDVRMEGSEELAYGLLAEGIPAHTYALLLDLSPLPERGMLLLESQICLAFVDRTLGGRSKTPPNPRPLTSIDQAAAEGVIEIVLRSFREGWKDFCPAKMSVVDRRPALDQLQFVSAGEPVLAVTLLLKGDLGEGRIRLCVPVGSLKAMAGGDSARATAVRPGPEKVAAMRSALSQCLEKATLPVTATVGTADMPLRNLTKLNAGDIIRLDHLADAPVLLSVGGRPAFLVRMGLRGRSKAVQVVQRLDIKEE